MSAADRRLYAPGDLDALAFDERGLVPVIAQDASTGSVLMLAWANRDALTATLSTGQMHFWSRSRGALWRKGETSGNTLALVSLYADCDGDTVLARVQPHGPACHTGDATCFGEGALQEDSLAALWAVLRARQRDAPEGSYTAKLLSDDNLRLKKLGEESAELVTALARGDAEQAVEEAADLLYHVMVALLGADASWGDVLRALEARRGG